MDTIKRSKNALLTIALVLVLAASVAVSQGGAKAKADPCIVSGELTSNETWTSGCVYVAEGVVVPDGVTLTIDAGTIVKVNSPVGIEVTTGGTLDGLAKLKRNSLQ